MATTLSNLLLLALVVGSTLLWSRRRRFGAALISAVTILLVLIALFPIPQLFLWPLEHRFERFNGSEGDPVSGIILLGGGVMSASLTELMGHPVLSGAAYRVKTFLSLARDYPDARLVVVGGGTNSREALREAPLIRSYILERGVKETRITIEQESRTTFENATLSRDLVEPGPNQTWLLVTTARHMPRAVATFRHAGWNVVAAPAGARASDLPWSIARVDLRRGIGLLGLALHEYVGLFAYRVSSRTATLWPEP